jgi:7-carboxy-7-deazaguanine synthase
LNIPKVFIHSVYDSIQGEGHLTGHLTKFIRFQGCGVKCHWCDSINTWKHAKGAPMNALDLTKEVQRTLKPNMWVCITGGEPLEQYRSLRWIVEKFETIQIKNVSIETVGAPIDDIKQIIDLYNSGLFFSISPKLPSALLKRYDQHMFENIIKTWRDNIPIPYKMQFKFIVSEPEDLEALTNTICRIGICMDCHLFIQIEASKVNDRKFVSKVLRFIKKNPKFRLTIQQHVVLGIK